MEIKQVYPLTIKRKERTLWDKSNYAAKAVISGSADILKDALKDIVSDLLKRHCTAVCIGLGLLDRMIEKLKDQFRPNTMCGTFPPKGRLVVRAGAAIFCLTNQEDIIKLIQYWGTLDGIQIYFHTVCTEGYVYNRHDFKAWTEIMNYARVIITDTGGGEEF